MSIDTLPQVLVSTIYRTSRQSRRTKLAILVGLKTEVELGGRLLGELDFGTDMSSVGFRGLGGGSDTTAIDDLRTLGTADASVANLDSGGGAASGVAGGFV